MFQKWSSGGGEIQFDALFCELNAFGHQGIPVELPSDFQEYFCMMWTPIRTNFGMLFVCDQRAMIVGFTTAEDYGA